MKRVKVYQIQVEKTSEGSKLSRVNNGFNSLELLGLLNFLREDIFKQLRGEIKPDVVKRTVIERNLDDLE